MLDLQAYLEETKVPEKEYSKTLIPKIRDLFKVRNETIETIQKLQDQLSECNKRGIQIEAVLKQYITDLEELEK